MPQHREEQNYWSASGCWWTGFAGLILQPFDTVMWYWTGTSRQSPVHTGKACEPRLCNNKIWFHAHWISLSSPLLFFLSVLPNSTFIYISLHATSDCLLTSLFLCFLSYNTHIHTDDKYAPPSLSELFWPAIINMTYQTKLPNCWQVSFFSQ